MANVIDRHALSHPTESTHSRIGDALDLLKVLATHESNRRELNDLLSLPHDRREALKPIWQDLDVNRR